MKTNSCLLYYPNIRNTAAQSAQSTGINEYIQKKTIIKSVKTSV